MALTPALTFVQNINGTEGVITDSTADYGVGGNPLRTDLANFLYYSKNAINGTRTFYDDVVNTDPLNTLSWSILTPTSGWTSATLLMIAQHNTVDGYVAEILDDQDIVLTPASIIYYATTGFVYKCIQDHTNVLPDAVDGTDYWEVVENPQDLIDYAGVDQFTEDFMVDFAINTCVTEGFIGIHKCDTLQEMEPAIKNWALYNSAVANFQNGAPEEMERIIIELDKICTTC